MKAKPATPEGICRKGHSLYAPRQPTQRHRLLTHHQKGPIDTLLVRLELNMHPGARAQELRVQGHESRTQNIMIIDEQRSHQDVALYTLVKLANPRRATA